MPNVFNSERQQILIFPSWLKFKFKWEDLPHVFPFPDKYEFADPELLGRLIDLGYSVSSNDYAFIDGPCGGGLIIFDIDFSRCFPKTLLLQEISIEKPPGFSRPKPCRLHILIPRISAAHRLREEAMPLAPSPAFSVEPLSSMEDEGFYFVLGFDKKNVKSHFQLPEGFPTLGLQFSMLDDGPPAALERLSKFKQSKFEYVWYKVSHSQIELQILVAAAFYLGLDLAAQTASLRVMHVFSNQLPSENEYRSATTWTQLRGKLRNSDDW